VPPLRHGGGTVVSATVSVEMNPLGVKSRPWRTKPGMCSLNARRRRNWRCTINARRRME